MKTKISRRDYVSFQIQLAACPNILAPQRAREWVDAILAANNCEVVDEPVPQTYDNPFGWSWAANPNPPTPVDTIDGPGVLVTRDDLTRAWVTHIAGDAFSHGTNCIFEQFCQELGL